MVQIVAELSGNHGGSLAKAIALIRAAVDAGADVCKWQAFDPERLTLDHDGPGFVLTEGIWAGRRLIDLYRETAVPLDWHREMARVTQELGARVGVSVFDDRSADFIADLDPDWLKIASLEIVDIPLIRHVASKGYPVILSCGMASTTEIVEAMDAAGAGEEGCYVTLLHCPPGYPAKAGDADLSRLNALLTLSPDVGLSDHSLSTTLPAVAVACGAQMIEKHLTLARDMGGPDAAFSLEPNEFKAMVAACREASAAMSLPETTAEPHRGLRRSLYVVKPVARGEAFTSENVRSIRPGGGLPPKMLDDVLGKAATRAVAMGEPLGMDMVSGLSLSAA